MDSCLFCKMINNQIPVERVYEDDSIIIIKDINPQAPYHYLAIPKKHYAGIQDIPASESYIFQQLFSAVSEYVKKENLVDQGYRLVINYGEKAGQSVHHIHVHILSGRNFGWPPG